MKNILTLSFILISACTFGQLPKTIIQGDSGEPYDIKEFTASKLNAATQKGVYHLGESEGERDLIILPYRAGIIIQMAGNDWGVDRNSGTETWQKKYITFNTVALQGNRFSFGKYQGVFAVYDGKIKKAVLLNGDPTSNQIYGRDTVEAGHFQMDLAVYYDGMKYPEVSLKTIDEAFLAGKSTKELKYMCNEVFARYGLIFQNPKIAAIFKEQYRPWRKNVDNCLTSIEKENIKLIRAYMTRTNDQ